MSNSKLILSTFGITDVGCVREHNEDAILVLKDTDSLTATGSIDRHKPDLGTVLVVADGVGGLNAGEVASRIAKETILARFAQLSVFPESEEKIYKYLRNIMLDAHRAIVQHGQTAPTSPFMGTTLIISWIVKDFLYVCWSGDSRCYMYNPNNFTAIKPFTDDHSIVWQRVLEGEMTAEQARVDQQSNLILQALGDADRPPIPSFRKAKISAGDRILICSDGLWGMLRDAEIQQILDMGEATEPTCRRLLDAAKKAGGKDNISVLLADVKQVPHSSSRGWFYVLLFLLIFLLLLVLGWLWGQKSSNKSSLPSVQTLAAVEARSGPNAIVFTRTTCLAPVTKNPKSCKLV